MIKFKFVFGCCHNLKTVFYHYTFYIFMKIKLTNKINNDMYWVFEVIDK